MEENNMKNKDNKKDKRKISILTVFLWITLIVVMSVITISGIVRNNAVEDTDVETRKITVQVDFSEYFEKEGIKEEENKVDFMENWYWIYIVKTNNITEESNFLEEATFVTNEENVGVYEVKVAEEAKYIMYHSIDYIPYTIESEENEIEYIEDNYWNEVDYGEEIKEEKYIYKVKLRFDESAKNITIKVDFSNFLEDENFNENEKNDVIENLFDYFDIVGLKYENENNSSNTSNIELKGLENNIATYIVKFKDIRYKYKYIGFTFYSSWGKYNSLKGYAIAENGNILNLNYNNYMNYFVEDLYIDKDIYEISLEKMEPKLSNDIKWRTDGSAILEIQMNNLINFYPDVVGAHQYDIFIEKLDDNFKVSEEYKNDQEWLIVNEEEIKDDKINKGSYIKLDFENNEYIPEYIYANFINKNNSSNKKYIYVQDKNLLYCLVPSNYLFKREINLELKKNTSNIDSILNFETKVIHFYHIKEGSAEEQGFEGYKLLNKNIKYKEEEKARIVVNKLVNNEIGNNTYYVGIFENETDETAGKVYSIETIDGIGSKNIEIDGYDNSKEYYMYEVNKDGKKISNENIKYNKNKVLENFIEKNEYKVLSDKEVVSAVYTNKSNGESIGLGENYYVDNSLVSTTVKEDVIIISSQYEEKVHLVKYETEKYGTLEGDLQEVVKEGEKPIKIPEVKSNENYEFENWVVIKNGEEIKVVPSEYEIVEDTTFIAKYKKIEKEVENIEKEDKPNLPNTSDINIWLYVGTFVISILIICIIICVLVIIRKKNK